MEMYFSKKNFIHKNPKTPHLARHSSKLLTSTSAILKRVDFSSSSSWSFSISKSWESFLFSISSRERFSSSFSRVCGSSSSICSSSEQIVTLLLTWVLRIIGKFKIDFEKMRIWRITFVPKFKKQFSKMAKPKHPKKAHHRSRLPGRVLLNRSGPGPFSRGSSGGLELGV